MKKKYIIVLLTIILAITGFYTVLFAKSSEKLSILISNDDGYNAPGIKALAEILSLNSNVFVAAPLLQQSGTGHGVTYREPIFVEKVGNEKGIPWYSISATPATCVRLAIEELIKDKPDLVITGINSGTNLGLTTYLSGTVGAAREGFILGIPSIAVSTVDKNNNVYKESANYISSLVKKLQNENLIKPGLFLNVNIPEDIETGIKGIKITKLSQKSMTRKFEKRVSPDKRTYFWNTFTEDILDEDNDTDVNAFNNGYIVITPLKLDTTNNLELSSLKPLTEVLITKK